MKIHALVVFAVLCFLRVPSWALIVVQLKPAMSSPQPLATAVQFSAKATDTSSGTLDYQFAWALGKGSSFNVFQAYDIGNTAVFAPFTKPGTYTVQVTARNLSTGETKTASKNFTFSSLVTGTLPVISKTVHPLVALYSAPGCATGSSMYIQFSGGGLNQVTSSQPCTGTSNSVNFYVAGMLPQTTYTMNYVVETGSTITSTGPTGMFTTGSLPNLPFPPITIPNPVNSQTDTDQPILILDSLGDGGAAQYFPVAVNLQGQVLWYYSALAAPAQKGTFGLNPAYANGDMWVILQDPKTAEIGQILREIDLAGNTVRQVSATEVNVQLAALGYGSINGFDHDMEELPNGHILVKCTQEKLYPAGTQPYPPGQTSGMVDILGDAIVDMDANFNVKWFWSGYDHLDVSRTAPLGEYCDKTRPGCGPVLLAPLANDWLHGNSLVVEPTSGDIIYSMRDQDWIIKIDYQNGTGTGNTIWKLGIDGNFAITSTDPFPWFSHQHDARYQLNGTTVMSIFDNGNTRIAKFPGENSRGYVLSIDEPNLTCTPLMLADMGIFSQAVGSAQRLNNGNYYFEAGLSPGNASRSEEFLFPSAALNWELTDATYTYRGYRMMSMYLMNSPSN